LVTAIVAAAGRGTRLGSRKQLLDLLGKPVVAWCLEEFAASPSVDGVIVACEADEAAPCERLARAVCGAKLAAVVTGGERRQDSVLAALRRVSPETEFVLVHDGARPFVDAEMIERVLAAARTYGAAVVGVSVKDTIKQIGEGGVVLRTIPRDQLVAAQTPQAFARDVLFRAHQAAEAEGFLGTDDAMLVEWAGITPVHFVEGSFDNIKITTPEDLAAARAIAKRRIERS
jgi:2-C-methyl-D-erythritol 4-phosphate cytidylyltransferase